MYPVGRPAGWLSPLGLGPTGLVCLLTGIGPVWRPYGLGPKVALNASYDARLPIRCPLIEGVPDDFPDLNYCRVGFRWKLWKRMK